MRSLTLITGLCSGILVLGLTSFGLAKAQTSPSFQINAPLQDGNGNRFFPESESSSGSEPDFDFEGESFEFSPQHNLAIDKSHQAVIDGKFRSKTVE